MTLLAAEVVLDGFTGQVGDGCSTSLSLVAELCVELVGEFDGSSLHSMPAYPISPSAGRSPNPKPPVEVPSMRVSTREATVLDLVSFPAASGALFNVATVIGEMLSENAVEVGRLAEVAAGYPTSIVRRTGWLLDYMAERVDIEADTGPLLALAPSRTTPTPLDPDYGRSGTVDRRWSRRVPGRRVVVIPRFTSGGGPQTARCLPRSSPRCRPRTRNDHPHPTTSSR